MAGTLVHILYNIWLDNIIVVAGYSYRLKKAPFTISTSTVCKLAMLFRNKANVRFGKVYIPAAQLTILKL